MAKMTYEQYRDKLKKFLIKDCNDTKENVEKFLKAEEDLLKRSYDKNPDNIDYYGWGLLYE